jgi:hypothetical protein
LPPALILARKHRWLWPYRSRRAALSAREGGKAFGVAVMEPISKQKRIPTVPAASEVSYRLS